VMAAMLTTQTDEGHPAVGAATTQDSTLFPPIELPAEIPDGFDSGTLDTPLGPARWVHLQGGPDGLPRFLRPLPAPGGFISLDDEDPQAVRLWRSPDLISWTPEPLPIDIGSATELSLQGGAYLLRTISDGLWRSDDTVAWQPLKIAALDSPFPAGMEVHIDLGSPLSSAGVTIVPLTYSPVNTASYLGLLGPGEKDVQLDTSEEPGIYQFGNRSLDQKVRFEETETGLRVIDATSGAELAELDGVNMDFIERWAAEPGGPGPVSEIAVVEGDALVPVTRLGSSGERLTVFGTDAGFFAYGHHFREPLIHVWTSVDGITWTEADPLGDDPGEPSGRDAAWFPDEVTGELHVQTGRRMWTSADGVAWQVSALPEGGATRLASGWLTATGLDLSFKYDGDDAWVGVDLAELELQSYAGPGESELHFQAISPDTIVASVWNGPSHETWIITLDELPS
jgi:hypothetical protein